MSSEIFEKITCGQSLPWLSGVVLHPCFSDLIWGKKKRKRGKWENKRENCKDSTRYKRFGKRDLHGTTKGKLQQSILRNSLQAVGQAKLFCQLLPTHFLSR